MPSISFSTLKKKIVDGTKKQTIRPLRSSYWLRFKKGDRAIGYWKMRTKDCEKLFESEFSEDPFIVLRKNFTDNLFIRDGFNSLTDGEKKWFAVKYGPADLNPNQKFVILRWK